MTLRTLFNGAIPSSGVSNEPGVAYNLGFRFQVLVNGNITGLRLYKTKENLDTGRDFGVWSIAVGTTTSVLIGSATSSGEPVNAITDPGWIDLAFATPLPVVTGVDYAIGIRNGNVASSGVQASYAFQSHLFTAANITDASNSIVALKSLDDGTSSSFNGNGLFEQTTFLVAPSNGFNSTWYGTDLIFDDGTGGTTTLTAAEASYALTDESANLLRNRSLTSSQASFSFTVEAVSLIHDRSVGISQASYVFGAEPINLSISGPLTLSAGTASYTLSAIAAALRHIVPFVYSLDRTYIVPVETRIFVVSVETRTFDVDNEIRSFGVI